MSCRTVACALCSKEFITNVKNRKFCGRRCLALAHIATLHAHRGTKPRTYYKRNRSKHGSAQEREWSQSVMRRDKYTCQRCGTRGGRLQSHHIKPWSTHPRLRFTLSNGLTLCVPCHKLTDTYGYKARTAKRLSQEVFQFGEESK